MTAYVNLDQQNITKKEWRDLSDAGAFILKQFRNDKIWLTCEWLGHYDKSIHESYRHTHVIKIKNKVTSRSEWVVEDQIDSQWVEDPISTQLFRSLASAEEAYNDLLLTYTDSYLEEGCDGELELVEEGNDLAPVIAVDESMTVTQETLSAAESKGIFVGGWS